MTTNNLLVYLSYGYFLDVHTRSCYEFCDVHGTLEAAKTMCEEYSTKILQVSKPEWKQLKDKTYYVSYVTHSDGREFCFQIDTKFLS